MAAIEDIQRRYRESQRDTPITADLFKHETQKALEDHRRGLAALQSFLTNHEMWSKCMTEPVSVLLSNPQAAKGIFGRVVTESLFLFENVFYEVGGPYSEDDRKLLLIDFVKRRRRKVEQLRSECNEGKATEIQRRPIPEEVRHEVWRRDQGKCVICGSNRDLEFDHIIPVVRGGSSTARNIQLLCETCNRRKSDDI